MIVALIVSQVLSWLLIAALAFALLALARQVGVLHTRIAPAGALTTASGPAVGDIAPVLSLKTIDGAAVSVGKAAAAGRLQLLMFVSPMCPICKELIPVAKSFARREKLDVVFVGDDALDDQREMIRDLGIAGLPFVNGPDVGRAYVVDKLPHAVLLDHAGVVLSKGLVNSREHLESLVVSHETGLKSVQDYIVTLRTKTA
jgi:methylamine dehydrogenase accessory protein MauD